MAKADPNRLIRYPLSWPAWLAEEVAEAANGRAMSVAAWLRDAAIQRLTRDKAFDYSQVEIVHLDGDPENNEPENLLVRKRQP